MQLAISIGRIFGFIALAGCGLVAFFSIFIGFPGQIGIALLIGIVAWVTGWERVGVVAVLVMVGFSIALEGLDPIAGFLGARRGGGTLLTGVSALVGSLVVAALAAAIPIPVVNVLFGSFVGSFAGAFGYEYLRTRRAGLSFRVGLSTLLGRMLSTFVKAAAACGIVAFAVWRLLSG